MHPRLRTLLLGTTVGMAMLLIDGCYGGGCACPPTFPGISGPWRGVSTNLDTVALTLLQSGTSVEGSGTVLRPTGAGAGARLDLDVTGTVRLDALRGIRLVATGWYDGPVELVGGERTTATGRMLVLRYHRGPIEPDSVTLELRRP